MSNAVAGDQITSVHDLDLVVDNDFHIAESSEDLLPYLDDPWDMLLTGRSGNTDETHDIYGSTPIYPEAASSTPAGLPGASPSRWFARSTTSKKE